jgi:hypothetical protein
MPISESESQAAAQKLNCDVAAVKAVAEVECGKYGAFLPTGDPVILFEHHKFSKFTGRKYDQTHPDISNRKSGGYGAVSEQHGKLARAAALDRDAALQSCSWGLFQVMGMHCSR